MSEIRISRELPHPPEKVWRVLTDPKLMALWGMRPEGFAPQVGNRFRLVGTANKHWRGFVDCEVLEVREREKLRYAWVGDDSGARTIVTCTLQAVSSGTRFTLEHAGFAGIGGFFLAKFIMGPGWRKTLDHELLALLADLDATGALKAGSTLKPLY